MRKLDDVGLDPRDLLLVPDLWASIIFGWDEVPDFHSWWWRFLTSDIKYLVSLWPAGCGKSTIGTEEHTIYEICLDPNRTTGLVQKGIEQARREVETIQRHLAYNRVLIDLYGPFKPPGDTEGYPWSNTTFRVVGNTDRGNKTNTVHAFGVESADVLGYRFDTIRPDDVCTDKNSHTPEARAKLEAKLTTEWDKTLIGSELPRLRMVGTAFAYDDLYLSKMRPGVCSDYIGPNDWREPDEVDSSGYVVILKDAEVGMKKNPLWVKQLPWEELKLQKSLGVSNYNRRLRNIVQDPGTAVFQEAAIRGEDGYPGCLDYNAVMGYRDPAWRVLCGVDPSSGKDTGAAAQFAHITVGIDPADEDVNVHVVDLFTAPVPMVRREDYHKPPDKKSQVGTIIHRHHKYHAEKTYIEENSQQFAWYTTTLDADPTLRGNIRPHNTGRKKVDKTVGVEAMAGIVESGRLRIPYGDEYSKKRAEELIEQLVRYPDYSLSDLVMATWFCMFNLKKRHKVKVFDYNKLRREAKPLKVEKKK